MKLFALIGLALGFCTSTAQAADSSRSCAFSMVVIAKRPPAVDLNGKLPVKDYLDVALGCSQWAADNRGQMPIPESAWLQEQSKSYSESLARTKYGWLVLPAQTQYFGFDRVERGLIGAEVAEALVPTNDRPDVFLAGLALGETRRRFGAEVVELVGALGATHLVEIYAGHDGQKHMTLTVLLEECMPGVVLTCKTVKQHDWRALAFSDQAPPFLIVHGLAAQIRAAFGIPAPKTVAAQKSNVVPLLGLTPARLAAADFQGDLTVDALIAALVPDDQERTRHRLNALNLRRSLRAGDRFFAALAAKALDRRPYALELIRGIDQPDVNALRELLNGNLPEAQAGLAAVNLPARRLILAFGANDLALRYGRKPVIDPGLPAAVFGEAANVWLPLIARRFTDLDGWGATNSEAVKRTLDAAFPVNGLDVKSILSAGALGDSRDLGDFNVANYRHMAAAAARLDTKRCCGAANGRDSGWQLYWLLAAINDANVLKDLQRADKLQALPENALRFAEAYRPFLAGQAEFEAALNAARADAASKAPNDVARGMAELYEQMEMRIGYWSQGQSKAAAPIVARSSAYIPYADAYDYDFPRRPYWPRGFLPPTPDTQAACDALAYMTAYIQAPYTCAGATPKEQAQLRADLRGRFHGMPNADQLFPEPVAPTAPVEDRLARLRTALRNDPDDDSNYGALGDLLILQDGNYLEAQKIYLSAPEIKAPDTDNAVGLSNDAYGWGSGLFWRGQPELARPLFQISANLNTGSEGSMESATRLALMDGDFESALEGARERATRYSSPYGYRDYLSLLHVTGRGDEARHLLLQVANRDANPQVWAASLVDQRMSGMTYEKFKTWILSNEIRTARYRGRRFAPFVALTWVTTDRKPPADFTLLMQQVERDAKRERESTTDIVLRPHPTVDGSSEILRPSPFSKGKNPESNPVGAVTSEFVLLADALVSFHAGDHAAAVRKFVALADLYPIEHDYTEVALAYFAYSAAKTRDAIGLEKYINALPNTDQDFDVWLSRAFFAAVRHDANAAETALTRAFNVRPHTEARPVMTEYQWAEACEIALGETHDARFERMLVRWARQIQRIMPTEAWAYAVEAQYSKVPVDANRALALALYLDPASPRIAKASAARVAAARAWLKTNNPFLRASSPKRAPGIQPSAT